MIDGREFGIRLKRVFERHWESSGLKPEHVRVLMSLVFMLEQCAHLKATPQNLSITLPFFHPGKPTTPTVADAYDEAINAFASSIKPANERHYFETDLREDGRTCRICSRLPGGENHIATKANTSGVSFSAAEQWWRKVREPEQEDEWMVEQKNKVRDRKSPKWAMTGGGYVFDMNSETPWVVNHPDFDSKMMNGQVFRNSGVSRVDVLRAERALFLGFQTLLYLSKFRELHLAIEVAKSASRIDGYKLVELQKLATFISRNGELEAHKVAAADDIEQAKLVMRHNEEWQSAYRTILSYLNTPNRRDQTDEKHNNCDYSWNAPHNQFRWKQ